MVGAGPSALFAGDLGDPWVAAIADALPAGTARLDCPGDLPEAWPNAAVRASAVVIHRPRLTASDAERLRRLRGVEPPPRVVLCIGPHARYQALQRWEPLADAILPEATAAETVARHLDPPDAPPGRYRGLGPLPRVAAVAAHFELRALLAEACRAAGFAATPARDWAEAGAATLAVWDVPVLEPSWTAELEAAARRRSVVALIAFADRELVARARTAGAAACLELPCDPADLAFVLERLAPGRPTTAHHADPAHRLPPPPAARARISAVPRTPA